MSEVRSEGATEERRVRCAVGVSNRALLLINARLQRAGGVFVRTAACPAARCAARPSRYFHWVRSSVQKGYVPPFRLKFTPEETRGPMPPQIILHGLAKM